MDKEKHELYVRRLKWASLYIDSQIKIMDKLVREQKGSKDEDERALLKRDIKILSSLRSEQSDLEIDIIEAEEQIEW